MSHRKELPTPARFALPPTVPQFPGWNRPERGDDLGSGEIFQRTARKDRPDPYPAAEALPAGEDEEPTQTDWWGVGFDRPIGRLELVL